jgi:hypothetical protein
MGGQLVARPLPKHRTTQTQNKHINTLNIHVLCEIRTHDPGFERAKTVHDIDRSATPTGLEDYRPTQSRRYCNKQGNVPHGNRKSQTQTLQDKFTY